MTKNIIITGASSGIGAALAKQYAASGVRLGLIGRNEARLQEIAKAATAQGAEVEIAIIDVCNTGAMAEWLTKFNTANPIDILIANAGISAGAGGLQETHEKMREIFAINLDGVLNTILPIIPFMQARKSGQIALMSSLAGIRGMPSCPAYSASKGAVRFLGEGLRGELKDYNIKLSVICPGYIKTPMTDVNKFPMPFIMSAEKSAKIIIAGLEKNKSRIAFPLALYLPLWLMSCLPMAITDWFFAALPRK